mmetsp:Transcript_12651/g.46237  ORF Transcript_12651/g.46237 Transcript_12651/m.46237 type:complete len:92 (-) Transcript_12651:2528-2803(-)
MIKLLMERRDRQSTTCRLLTTAGQTFNGVTAAASCVAETKITHPFNASKLVREHSKSPGSYFSESLEAAFPQRLNKRMRVPLNGTVSTLPS